MVSDKQVIGGPIVIDGRKLSLSKAVRAGDFIFLTGQVPMLDGKVITNKSIEFQTRLVLDEIGKTLSECSCTFSDVVKTMVWLRSRNDFSGFNLVYGEYFSKNPPARSAVVSELLVDVKVEIEAIVYKKN